MELSLLQIIILSIIQAITEFLPISSSAHLLLPSKVLGWPDQGIIFDITVHFATLMAVLIYFRDDFLRLSFYVSKTFLFLVISTLPIVLIALFFEGIGDYRFFPMFLMLFVIFWMCFDILGICFGYILDISSLYF